MFIISACSAITDISIRDQWANIAITFNIKLPIYSSGNMQVSNTSTMILQNIARYFGFAEAEKILLK